ncbi:MAG TPA: flavodoxin family protein [Clostridiales bacterium]|nr:flavodoxin family protein [Clostridiales bacterium]
MVKALVIMGSPRIRMNTDQVLEKIIQGLKQEEVFVEKVELAKRRIVPCTACGYCERTGSCMLRDDMTDLYKQFDESDMIIVGSPLYFNSVTGITKIVIDRCQAFWSSKYVLHKPSIDRSKPRIGAFVCTAGAPHQESDYIGATVVMDLFFRAINADYRYNFFVDRTDQILVENRPDVLENAVKLGERLFKEAKIRINTYYKSR